MRSPRFLQDWRFWFALSWIALAAVVGFLFLANRDLALQNQRDLEYLCNTTTTIEIAVVAPLLFETENALKALPVGAQGRQRLMRLKTNLQIARAELAATQACEPVR